MSVYADLVGQEHIAQILQKAVAATRVEDLDGEISSQEMTHAWVFTGPPGSGRSSALSLLHKHSYARITDVGHVMLAEAP